MEVIDVKHSHSKSEVRRMSTLVPPGAAVYINLAQGCLFETKEG